MPDRLMRRVWYFLNRRRRERELEREMASHRAMMAEPHRFGGMLRLREQSADVWGWTWVDDVGRDLRYGARQLRRAPRFTVAAMSILTLGAGVALSVLHVANAATVYLFSVQDADRMVRVARRTPEISSTFPFAAFRFYREHATLFSYLVSEHLGTRVSVGDDPAPRASAFVSDSYFDDLKIVAAAGRLPDARDSQASAPPAVALGYRYWQRHFEGDPGVIGRAVRVNGTPVMIVGVLPHDFDGLGPPRTAHIDIWLPMAVRPQVIERSGPIDDLARADSALYGTLVPGASMAAASSQLETLTVELHRQQAGRLPGGAPIEVVPLLGGGRFEADVAVLLVLFFLIFFSACANLGNMLLARGVGRLREIDMRLALGASRWRVVRQLLTENLLLAMLGGATGAAAGYAGAQWLLRLLDMPAGAHIVLDGRMLAVSSALVVVAMLGFGLAPALQAVRRIAPGRTRQALVAVQVAASAVLLILATLLARGDERRRAIDLAFDYQRTIVVDPQLGARTLSPPAQRAILDDMTARLERLPGVDGVTLAGPVAIGPPLSGQQVAPSYFGVLGLRILRGRAFLDGEPNVLVVSESTARRLWPDRDALGQTWSDRGNRAYVVVGIVEDSGVSAAPGNRGIGEAYIPLSEERLSRVTLLAHTQGDPRALLRDVRAAAAPAGLTPTVTMMEARLTMTGVGSAGLVGILSVLATLLAFTGVSGLVAFAVAQRTREIGVRMALGARPPDILRTLLTQYAAPLASGSAAGLALAFAGSLVLRRELYGLPPLDPISYAAGMAALAAAMIAALLLPARRALRISPATALRWE